MKTKIPQPLRVEHRELHKKLDEIVNIPGPIGKAAEGVVSILHPHFIKEEEYALPPLGMLKNLVEGEVYSDMEEKVIAMTSKLKKDLPNMLDEHKRVINALENLIKTSEKEKRTDIVQFANRLMLHAQMEEEVLYPAAILIGEFVKLKRVPQR